MPNLQLPRAAVPAGLPARIRLQIVSPRDGPPSGDDWLHEIKHDGHRLVAVIGGRGSTKLLSRNGIDRTPLFRGPVQRVAASGRPMVLDGEIAVPDDRGLTHLDALGEALAGTRPDRLAYFAFDLLYLDGNDLRRCPIEEHKAALRRMLDDARGGRIVYVDHVTGQGVGLFERVPAAGAEGIVSKRLGRPDRGAKAATG